LEYGLTVATRRAVRRSCGGAKLLKSAATVEQRLEDGSDRTPLPVAKAGSDLQRQLALLLIPLEARKELLAEPGEWQLDLHGEALGSPEILRPRAGHR